jgi:hypothetical protein
MSHNKVPFQLKFSSAPKDTVQVARDVYVFILFFMRYLNELPNNSFEVQK